MAVTVAMIVVMVVIVALVAATVVIVDMIVVTVVAAVMTVVMAVGVVMTAATVVTVIVVTVAVVVVMAVGMVEGVTMTAIVAVPHDHLLAAVEILLLTIAEPHLHLLLSDLHELLLLGLEPPTLTTPAGNVTEAQVLKEAEAEREELQVQRDSSRKVLKDKSILLKTLNHNGFVCRRK